jgi:integrase
MGEALGLRWEDYDESAQTLSIRRTLHRLEGEYRLLDTKTRLSRRMVPLTDLAVAGFKRQAELQADNRQQSKGWDASWDGLIFRSPHGRPLNGSLLTHRFQEHLEAIGLPKKFRLHDLRHQAASILVAAGLPVREVQAMLGHASPTTTLAIYGHLVEGGQRAVADTMQRLLANSGAKSSKKTRQ